MADYVSELYKDPEDFVKSVGGYSGGYSDSAGGDDDDDEDAVEKELAALAGASFGSTDWKRLIALMPKPSPLALQGRYKHEFQDPKHRMGDLLEHCFKVYERKNPGDTEGKNFYQWLDAMPDLDRVMMIADNPLVRNVAKEGNIKPSMVKAFMKGVAYMDKAGRKSHKVFFTGGTANTGKGEAGVPLDTAEMQTVFSGKGFGIWVMSEKGKLYVGNHVKGMVHHSSFLAGADVMCGGEMMARKGKIEFLSAKSGHYNPGLEHMCWALTVLETCAGNFDAIKVAVWRDGHQTPLHLVSPKELFSNRISYMSWGKISADEMARLRVGNFAGFPS